MSRQFFIPTVLRMVPNHLLRELFEKLGHGGFDPCWPHLPEREIDPMLDHLSELPTDRLDTIESVLRSVFDLACESGFDALLEAGAFCGEAELGLLVPGELSVWGRSMWAWLHYPGVFDKAQIIHQIEHLSWWRKRSDLPANSPDKSPEAIAKLERDISSLLMSQGRGKECTVETMARGRVDYFFAYPDDFVQNVLVHDEDGRLAPAAFRKTLQIAFAYDREEGTLETHARLPKRMKEELEAIFAMAMLHWRLDDYDPDAAYELDQLKDAAFDLATDPEDGLRVWVRKMRLAGRYCGRRLLVEVDDEDDIHAAIGPRVNLEEVPLSEWRVTLATFCFEFLAADGRKPGRQSCDVRYPRSCRLRNARPERVELIQKYLKRWGIDRVAAAEPVLVAVGS